MLEVPNSALVSKKIGLWHRTLDGASGKWVQADRGALPSQSVFLPGEHQPDYLAGEPADDARFVPVFAHSLEHTGGYTHEDAIRVARTLLPDILYYDPNRPASYPVNGRTLSDDAIDIFLPIERESDDGSRGAPQRPACRVPLRRHPAHGPFCEAGGRLSGASLNMLTRKTIRETTSHSRSLRDLTSRACARKHSLQRLMRVMAAGIRTPTRTDWLPNAGIAPSSDRTAPDRT